MNALTPIELDRMRHSAELLLEARRTVNPINELPVDLRPRNLAEAYAIQDVIALALGPLGGWKIGAANPREQPVFAPMPLLGGFAANGATLGGTLSRLRAVEGEMAFLLGRDLPARTTPYTPEEVLAAVASCHPAIEILESAYTDPDKVDACSRIADLLMNGGFAYGSAYPDWRSVDVAAETATMSVDGVIRVESHAPVGFDPVRLLTWLANEGALRTGGLRAGWWITTGSWTGKVAASSGSQAIVRFSTLGEASISFE